MIRTAGCAAPAARNRTDTQRKATSLVLLRAASRLVISSIQLDQDNALPRLAICIPVRNEAAELPHLFDALDRLNGVDEGPVRLCLLLDGCIDGSAALARAYGERSRLIVSVAAVAPAPANAGRARHLAMKMGMEAIGADDGLLLTTDADSVPAPGWLSAMRAALARADVVAGRIVRGGDRPSPLQDRLERYYDALFALRRRLDPVPWEAELTHHHAGGANLGVRAEAYRALGGFVPRASGEDAQFLDDAARAGLRVTRDPASIVRTSDRRQGRVPGGLSAALSDLDGTDAMRLEVTHPVDMAWQYRHQALARAAFADGDLRRVATSLGLTHDHVRGVARDCPNAEAFAMRVVPVPPGGMRVASLCLAEEALSGLQQARAAA